MGKILVLAEKPSVGRELAKVLNCNQGNNGFLMGSKYIVTWALGHLVTLADPETYGETFKTWKIVDLPMLPKKMDLVVIKETSKQFGVVKSLLKRDDVDELVIATDAGREGELVARWILEKAGFRKPIKRLWISSQTEKAIKDGFNNLRPGSEYDNLFKSAECRAQADWLIGLNVTRALTCKHNAQLSAGRVQTPTLAMIIEREEEIRKFIPKDYWTISAKTNGFTVTWQDRNNGQVRLFNKVQAEEIVAKLKGQMAEVIEIKKEAKEEQPPLAYDLTELQRDANRRFGYSAKQTLNIMQRLYENYKIVSYPRTDSRYITNDIVPTLPERLRAISVGQYTKFASELLRGNLKVTKRLVDNTKVTDHHAIIPTEEYVDLNALSSEERNIFDLVAKRFIAVLNQPFVYEQTTVKISAKDENFYAKGKVIKSKGWKAVYDGQKDTEADEDNENEQSLPELKKGETLKLNSVDIVNGKTKPPARYTEATLLTAMEHPGRLIEDEGLREAIDKTSGLGTPATRADIIEKLFDAFYVERRGKEIIPTSKGTQLVNLAPEDLKSAELTAKWEQQLQLISKGKANSNIFIEEMKKYASKLVSNVIVSEGTYKHDNLTREKCPECGKFLLDVKNKKGKMLVCPDRECGYRKGISILSNARCPNCHKKMELKGEGENKIFACGCGYREKLSDFNKRKGEQVSKKEVSNFINKQEKDENINSTFADALAKWKK